MLVPKRGSKLVDSVRRIHFTLASLELHSAAVCTRRVVLHANKMDWLVPHHVRQNMLVSEQCVTQYEVVKTYEQLWI